MGPRPSTIRVSAEVLDDLRSRLGRTRWLEPLPCPGWAAGVDVGYLSELVAYWAGWFGWRTGGAAELLRPVHRGHRRAARAFRARAGSRPRPVPAGAHHGWPSSFAELLKLAPLLTDPAAHGADERDSFDVVIPSLPGFVFSAPPAVPGAATAASWADLWANLMTETLGCRRFGAQGQDIGAAVSIALAAAHPDVVAGIHLPGVVAFPSPGQPVSTEGQEFLDRQQRWRDAEGGYARLQATRPQTLAAWPTHRPGWPLGS